MPRDFSQARQQLPSWFAKPYLLRRHDLTEHNFPSNPTTHAVSLRLPWWPNGVPASTKPDPRLQFNELKNQVQVHVPRQLEDSARLWDLLADIRPLLMAQSQRTRRQSLRRLSLVHDHVANIWGPKQRTQGPQTCQDDLPFGNASTATLSE